MNRTNQIDKLDVAAYCIPTDLPESDGTLTWDSTTIVIVKLWSGGTCGLGYTYSDKSLVPLIRNKCEPVVIGQDSDSVNSIVNSLHAAMRNLGNTGLATMAVAAVDNALWDLRARIYQIPLVKLIGMCRSKIESYGSGGFTSYSEEQLNKQLTEWAVHGFKAVKMKIGRYPEQDKKRVAIARESIGNSVQLFVDANGAYYPKDACLAAHMLDEFGVSWYEEPVQHSDKDGLRFVREHVSPKLRISSGEYGFNLRYFKDLLTLGCIDIIQADATRCGTTCFLKVAALCESFHIPFSAHTAPSLHMNLCCSLPPAINVEYFHDHVRIEQMLFDGAAKAENGYLIPDLTVEGNGLLFKEQEAERYRCG